MSTSRPDPAARRSPRQHPRTRGRALCGAASLLCCLVVLGCGSQSRQRKVGGVAARCHAAEGHVPHGISPPSALRVANAFGRGAFGIAASGIQNDPVAAMRREVAVDRSAGARWLRLDINWAQIQARGPHRYDWAPLDRVVARARACGMRVLGTIVFAPHWALPAGVSGVHAPSPAAYARFAATAARRMFARGVHDFEIWNEPNIATFWKPRPDAAAYAALLKDAYAAIKRAAPRAEVISGGLSPAVNGRTSVAPVTFLRELYADGAGGSFDAVAVHPYTWPVLPGAADPGSAWYQVYGTSRSVRSVMTAHGDGALKVWGTEFGAPTDGPPHSSFVSLRRQAQMVSLAYRLWIGYPWAGPLFTYEGRDRGRVADTNENFFGLVRHDFTRKPAFYAYRRMAAAVATLSSR